MAPLVRPVRPEEWPALRDLRLRALAADEDAFGDTLARARAQPEEGWRAYAFDGPDSVTFVAESGGGFLGMARGRVHGADGGLYGMWVAPEARGAGLGRRLVEAVVGWARTRALGALGLDVSEERIPAVALYRACGFVPTGKRTPLDHHPGKTDIQMVRRLR
jgi:GNAT superfamily N-acetyltransferase